jgi:nitroreductase
MSPYRIVIVDDPLVRSGLSEAMLGGNGARVREAPVTAVFLGDLQSMKSIDDVVEMEKRAGKPGRYLRTLPVDVAAFASNAGCGPSGVLRGAAVAGLSALAAAGSVALPTPSSAEGWANKHVGIVAMSYMVAATAAGLATVAMEGFDSIRVKEACGIPVGERGRWSVPVVVATGFTSAKAAQVRRSARMEPSKMVRRNAFGRGFEGIPEELV